MSVKKKKYERVKSKNCSWVDKAKLAGDQTMRTRHNTEEEEGERWMKRPRRRRRKRGRGG